MVLNRYTYSLLNIYMYINMYVFLMKCMYLFLWKAMKMWWCVPSQTTKHLVKQSKINQITRKI